MSGDEAPVESLTQANLKKKKKLDQVDSCYRCMSAEAKTVHSLHGLAFCHPCFLDVRAYRRCHIVMGDIDDRDAQMKEERAGWAAELDAFCVTCILFMSVLFASS